MPRSLRLLVIAAALVLTAAACSSSDSADGETGTSAIAGASDTTVVAADTETETSSETSSEPETSTETEPAARPIEASVSIVAVSFESNAITVRNDGADELSLDGFFLCNRPTYAGAPAVTIAPGATADVDVTDLDIRASGGEFGLYRSSTFDSATEIVAYVQWGHGENGRASVAVEAGLIEQGEFVDNAEADFTVTDG